MKRILIAMAVMVPVLMMAGCGNSGISRPDLIVTAADAIKYMEDKYGEEFILEDRKPTDFLYEQSDLFCHTAEMDREINEHVQVFITEEEDGTHLSDNYFGYYVRPQVDEYIYDGILKGFPDVKVLSGPCKNRLADELTKESTLEDFLKKDGKYTISASIFIKKDPDTTNEEYEEGIKRFIDSFKPYGKWWHLQFYVVSDEIYDEADRHTKGDILHRYIKNGSNPDGENYFYCSSTSIQYDGQRSYKVD